MDDVEAVDPIILLAGQAVRRTDIHKVKSDVGNLAHCGFQVLQERLLVVRGGEGALWKHRGYLGHQEAPATPNVKDFNPTFCGRIEEIQIIFVETVSLISSVDLTLPL